MSKTWFTMSFTYAELYGLRNALRESGKEPELLDRIEEQIRLWEDDMDEYDKMKIFICGIIAGAGFTFGAALIMPLIWASKCVMGWFTDDIAGAMYAGVLIGIVIIIFAKAVSRGLYHD